MFAVVESGGKQYFVKQGSVISVEKLDAEVGKVIDLPICVSGEGKELNYEGLVKVEVLEQKRDKKIIIFKKKRRKGYRRRRGHRQYKTVLRVTEFKS